VWGIAPRWTLATLVLAVVQGVLPLLGLLLLREIVDAVVAGVTAPDKSAAFATVAWWVAAAALVGLMTALARSVALLVGEAHAVVVTDHMSDLIHAKSVVVDLEYYEDARYYDVLHRAQQEAPYRPTRMVGDLMLAGQSLVTLVGVVGVLFAIHWSVGLIIAAAALPSAYVRLQHSGRLYEWQRRRTAAERRSSYLHWLLTDGAHAKEVRIFGLGGPLRGWYRDLREELRAERLGIARRRAAADLGSQAVATAAVFGTFAYIAWRAVQGLITLGDLMMYYQALQTGLGALQGLLGAMAGLREHDLFLTSYREFMALETKVVEPARPVAVARPLRQSIAFEGVSFAYPDSGRTVLEHVDLTIRPGEVTALVGPNGSGKTTLVKLLCRLYDPQGGRVTRDGVDLREMSTTDLRRGVGVIFQDFARYQLTARENIWLGDVALERGDAAVERAAREAGAHELIAGLPRGYDTMLGTWFEEGEELSTGEWQKVALARAFVRDADVLVFDEPASALDPLAERSVFERIRELARGRAVVLVSHRFSTVREADVIHIVDAGRVVESGAHEELLARRGVYAAMYEVQARGYREA
jgi:ATP-binding cassette subfamily B protein